MTQTTKEETSDGAKISKPLRLWPGIVLSVLLIIVKLIVPVIMPGDALAFSMLGGILLGLLIVIWWVFLSRAPWSQRLGAVLLMVVALYTTRRLLHPSLALAGMGVLFYAYAIPVLGLALAGWAVLSRRLSPRARWVTMAGTILVVCGVWTLFRYEGITAEADAAFALRWSASAEDRLLAQAGDEQMTLPPPVAAAELATEWPGFRGPERNGIVSKVSIATDWSTSGPVELWRRHVGPGWSSFSVGTNLVFTQEQRGDAETVSCYSLATGDPVWRHEDPVRFWEAQSGAGPRGTPTLSSGRVYALGATGILNVLDATSGAPVWSRNVADDTETQVPMWGITSSPLVVDDMVVAAAAGSLIGYDRATGTPLWSHKVQGEGYSSPHLLQIDDVQQILLMNAAGASSFLPADGVVLWEYAWPGHPIVQPTLISNGDMLVSTNEKDGIRRIKASNEPDGWTVTQRWQSTFLNPFFNDSVVHKGNAYGFDGPFIACIDLVNGERRWRGGRYGRGQVVLLADQDVLLVLAEKGDLALVRAAPESFVELARMHAITGKTWNHPVVVGTTLLVRNAQEMAAFRLPGALE